MKWIRQISFLGWLLILTVGLYAVYNPTGFSIYHLWTEFPLMEALPLKIAGTAILLAAIQLVVWATFKQIKLGGVAILVLIIGLTLWAIHYLITFDIANPVLWQWLSQPLIGLILTIGWQWPRIWRGATGGVVVEDPDTPTN